MNKFLWSCAALLALCVTVRSLSCYTCDVAVLGYCLHDKHINCISNQTSCFTAVAKFSGDLLDIHEKGCAEVTQCSNTSGHILNVNYTITRTCCGSDLCNSATSIELPVTATLFAALAAVWSQWAL
ncbi:sperm acrosome membrane-associated protein 4-like [Echeneis naucrates]|uniref:sperm acrosome membrane-associated protein 4-like n=1 Tax=Echeneis naucrates TaxID=173247 RepID=UPI0011146B8E|nr:sperm acrosome membrane-associated protein 4-like [Echeneis naucrates]